MTCSVYPSRTYLLSMLTAMAVFLAAWGYLVWRIPGLPWEFRIVPGMLFGGGLLACLLGLLAKRPVVRVDETGISYHPKRFPKIEWPDVLGVERAPLLEPTPDGLLHHLKDGWRPVNVFVVGSEKYLRGLPNMLRQRLIADPAADAVRFQIEFMGLSASSAEVYECIRRHLDGRPSRG